MYLSIKWNFHHKELLKLYFRERGYDCEKRVDKYHFTYLENTSKYLETTYCHFGIA